MPTAQDEAKNIAAGNSDTSKKMSIQEAFELQRKEMLKYISNDKLLERFIRTVLTVIQYSPKLQSCTGKSILGAVMQGLALRLDFTPQLRQAYIIPYQIWDPELKMKINTAQFQIGYKGFVELFSRSQYYSDVYGDVVYEKDIIKIIKGTSPFLEHAINPLIQSRGKIIGYYAVATLTTGKQHFDYWSREAMLDYAKKHSQAYRADLKGFKAKEIEITAEGEIVRILDNMKRVPGENYVSPWTKDEIPMGCKTMIKKVLRDVPMPVDSESENEIRIKRAMIADESIRSFQPGMSIEDIFLARDERFGQNSQSLEVFDDLTPKEEKEPIQEAQEKTDTSKKQGKTDTSKKQGKTDTSKPQKQIKQEKQEEPAQKTIPLEGSDEEWKA